MILTFADVITAQEHRAILDQINGAQFVDGRQTAGTNLAARKNNEQVQRDATQIAAISAIVLDALRHNETFRNSVYPRQLHSLLVSRYRDGMEYGAHVDSALMGDATLWRTDLSLTLFLNEPDEYDGGELALESGSGELLVKLPARNLVCYPTGQLHRVRAVTRGERLVVVAWIQSHVRDTGAREALADLARALAALRASGADAHACELINKTHTNLLRRWAEA
jgi:PKHD-type hydroxylase